jgi:nucleoside-diphosphate-sugar epimerase
MDDIANRTCLVTGASGFLGSYVVEKLVERGARVRCLVRPTSIRDFLPSHGAEFVIGDVTDYASLRDALVGVDFVFHVAGLIKARRPEDYYRVNYLGTINLLEACRTYGDRLRRVVVVSSLAAVGPSEPRKPLAESAPCYPLTPYGKSKLRQEQAALAYQRDLPVTIVRPPTIYGPRDRETLLLFRAIALGIRPSVLGRSEVSVVHASDLAEGIILAAVHPAAVGQTFFLTGDDILSMMDLLKEITAALGRPSVSVPIPAWALRGAALVAEGLRNLGMAPIAFDRWKAEEILSGYWACSNARAKAQLGYAPRIGVSDGLAETAQWYRKMGWL